MSILSLPSGPSLSTICRYCTNSYRNPRILDCLHSYCLQCISSIPVHDEEGTNNSSITCPSCQHSTAIPSNGGVASLPANIRLANEAEEQGRVVKEVFATPPPSCESCEEESSPSVAYCKNCKDMLCNECWRMHKKLKTLRSHTTYSLDDLKGKSQLELVEMIAQDGVHTSCPTDGQEFDEKRFLIASDVEGLPRKKRKLEQVVERISEVKANIQDHKLRVDDMIQEAFRELRQSIDQREAELLAENTQMASSKEIRLSTQQEGIQQLIESIIHCLSVSSIATSEYSNEQLLAIANTIHNRATELQKRFTATPLEPCDTPSSIADFKIKELRALITQSMVTADPRAGPKCSAIVPRRRLGLGAIMRVKVITRNGQGEALTVGGATVRGRLSYNGGVVNDSLGITDNGDGTYLIDVTTEQQLGQHQLSITANGHHIQGSPFSLDIVPQRDYTKLKDPIQTITINGGNYAERIAFANNGDMFVTSDGDRCIFVYDASGIKKTTIGSSHGSGELQFQSPHGIDINGEVVYVAEWSGHRIHKLTTGGEFIGTFGEKGSAVGQFSFPNDVKISPDGKVYVADSNNHRVQVFNPDWSVSHVIDGTSGDEYFKNPRYIEFDLLGDVHVAVSDSPVKVFTSSGRFIREYGEAVEPIGLAIDPSGYCLVSCAMENTFFIFDPTGTLLHTTDTGICPSGTLISPIDDSLWDVSLELILKY